MISKANFKYIDFDMKLFRLATISIALLMTSCTTEVVKVYVDENGTEINSKEIPTRKFTQICDERGYAYQHTTYDSRTLVPMLANTGDDIQQVLCKDL